MAAMEATQKPSIDVAGLNVACGLALSVWSFIIAPICLMGCTTFLEHAVLPGLLGVIVMGLGAFLFKDRSTRILGIVVWLLYVGLMFSMYLFLVFSSAWIGFVYDQENERDSLVFLIPIATGLLACLVVNIRAAKRVFMARY